jgi:hypothetical protein
MSPLKVTGKETDMLNQIPVESLPDGTVLSTTAYWTGLPFTHYGIVQRGWNGRVLIHHNSKKIGHAATTGVDGFSDGNPVFIDSIPETPGEGWAIAERARADVVRGIPWTVYNNCEDMRSRALTGRDGSPTREAFVGVGLLGIALILVFKL